MHIDWAGSRLVWKPRDHNQDVAIANSVELEQKRDSILNPSRLEGQPCIKKKTDPTIPQSK
jgi:hypothetical protein